MCACSVRSNSVIPWTADYQAPLSMGSPGKKTAVVCHFLLQGLHIKALISWDRLIVRVFIYKVGISTWISDSTSRSFDSVKETEHTHHYINTHKAQANIDICILTLRPTTRISTEGTWKRILETLCLETHRLCMWKCASLNSFQIES